MNPTTLDWGIVLASIIICLIPALFYYKKGGSSTAEFFTSGRAAPWWLIGVSMVATTFSTDTPNLVTNFVRTGGVASNWQWWAFLLTGMATVFFFARLWRRSGVLTDLEFYEIRYSGKAASVVRGFRAIYLGLIFNCCIMASVNLAAAKIANIVLGWPMWQTLVICACLNLVFAAIAGLWGVLVIDFIQFGIAMTGAFAAAHYALAQPAVGGLAGLVAHLPAKTLNLLPDFSDWGLAVSIFVIPLTVQWWSVWYPGAEPGGGSYIAQRMLASRSERDALGGTLLFNTAHYALRSWPWIIVALASIIIFPTLDSIRTAFPNVDPKLVGHDMAYPAMLKFLPHGILGLMIAAMEAAYRSTIMTHLNWGSSYLVNDFWKRFIRPDASEKHYVFMGRAATALLVLLAGLMTYALDTAAQQDIPADPALDRCGHGPPLPAARWFWWRVNAWCEVAAMASSFICCGDRASSSQARKGVIRSPTCTSLLVTIGVTTVGWVATAFLTPVTDRATLLAFYRKVRPAGPGWKSIRAEAKLAASPDSLPQAFLAWMLGLMMVYGALFATGSFLYGRTDIALFWTATCVVGVGGLLRIVPRMWSGAGAA